MRFKAGDYQSNFNYFKSLIHGDLDIMQQKINEQLQRVAKQKKDELTQILEELDLPLELLSNEEANRTFPRLAVHIDHHNGIEEWYYNDGSKHGLLIARFKSNVQINIVNQ